MIRPSETDDDDFFRFKRQYSISLASRSAPNHDISYVRRAQAHIREVLDTVPTTPAIRQRLERALGVWDSIARDLTPPAPVPTLEEFLEKYGLTDAALDGVEFGDEVAEILNAIDAARAAERAGAYVSDHDNLGTYLDEMREEWMELFGEMEIS